SFTPVAASLPLFLLSGASGEYAFSLAAVVALTLTGSWIAALYLLPALTVWLIGQSHPSQQARERADPATQSRAQGLYAGILHVAIRFSPVVLVACFALVALSV